MRTFSRQLLPFPGLAHPEIEVIAEATRPQPDILQLWFTLRGDLSGIAIPDMGAPDRVDGLWQHTCVEAFLRAGDGGAYCEFNFSPTRQWAAYRFTGYREGMANLAIAAPDVNVATIARHFSVGAILHLPEAGGDAFWQLGLTAVIEETNGGKSYWALAHAAEKPDFHDPACFTLELPAPPLP